MEVKVTAWGGAVCVCSEHYTVKAIRILFLLVCPSITSVQPSSAGWSKRAARGDDADPGGVGGTDVRCLPLRRGVIANAN